MEEIMQVKKRPISSTLCTRLFFAALSLPLVIVCSLASAGAASAHKIGITPLQYVALGDSLPFGYQPNNDFTHGYVPDLFQALQAQNGYSTLVNLSCTDDSSATFINGDPNQLNSQRGCLVPQVQSSNQLSVAVSYLQQNASAIGLVTLQIGIDDFLNNGAINLTNCTINTDTFNTQLATVDQNLTQTILPQLQQALSSAPGNQAHLTLLDYYNPLQQLCPNTVPYIITLNRHLKYDAISFASFISIYSIFNKTNLCQLTWICNDSPPTAGDIHPTDQGYASIAERIYRYAYRYAHEHR